MTNVLTLKKQLYNNSRIKNYICIDITGLIL